MLILEPDEVVCVGVRLSGVQSVSVNEEALEVVAEGGDGGPHLTFVDVPLRRVRVDIRQSVPEGDAFAFSVGLEGALLVRWSAGGRGGAAGGINARGVVVSSQYTFDSGKGATRVVSVVCVSDDGSASPVVVQ
ncbi:MAG: hypothetical protein ACK54T_09160 [bacterium]